ncbi:MULTISPECIES: TIGR04211 family SH3 domain-containing protein [unclassified Pseudomonas]|uniref:TIGR04211 family SH3 domain-containing protein n=1 Tax=unclassified Pseudomonas TaxID=196821 RepID=UPI0008C70A7A|nr:TIGR04211 family SH3 domain-containing protein [Pseudomonas sp. NFR16]SEI55098.1 SH3 domain protein [Pseudomonas sp. NFR16]
MSLFRPDSATFPSPSSLPGARRRLLSAGLTGTLFALTLASQAHAETASKDRWVSDTLSTYVRSGPTDGYRIVGTLKSGQKVELLNTQGDYSQVRGGSGDSVWIPSADLQEVPGQAERLPQLTQQVADLSAQLKTIDDDWKTKVQGMQETLDSRKKLVDELEARSKDLNAQLTDAQSELRSTQAKLGDENNQVLMRYMVYGGSIAGAGLLLGLILPALTRGRKRNDRWF